MSGLYDWLIIDLQMIILYSVTVNSHNKYSDLHWVEPIPQGKKLKKRYVSLKINVYLHELTVRKIKDFNGNFCMNSSLSNLQFSKNNSYLHNNVECKIHEKIYDEYSKQVRCEVLRLHDHSIDGTEMFNFYMPKDLLSIGS